MEAGIDSLGAVELRNQLHRAAGEGAMVPSTLVFDHPTARGLAQFFATATPAAEGMSGERAAVLLGGVSLVCMRVVLPAGARGLQGAWQLTASGNDAFAPSPAARWEAEIASAPVEAARSASGLTALRRPVRLASSSASRSS